MQIIAAGTVYHADTRYPYTNIATGAECFRLYDGAADTDDCATCPNGYGLFFHPAKGTVECDCTMCDCPPIIEGR